MQLIGSHLYFSWSCHGTFSTSPRFSNAKPSARKLLRHLLVNQGTRANSKWPSRSITLTFSFPFVISGKENNCMYNIFHSRAVRGPVHTVLTSQPVKENLKNVLSSSHTVTTLLIGPRQITIAVRRTSNNVIKKMERFKVKQEAPRVFFLLWKGCQFPYLFFNHLLNCLLFIFSPAVFPKGVFLVTACLAPNISSLHA